jgi:hypothetical protein
VWLPPLSSITDWTSSGSIWRRRPPEPGRPRHYLGRCRLAVFEAA